jgi:hypothetical protein
MYKSPTNDRNTLGAPVQKNELRLPDFLIIGATRCGTTSLHRYIASHPQVFVPKVKELHFFDMDRNFRAGLHAYSECFLEAESDAIIGESTPAYFHKGMLRDSNGQWYVCVDEDSGTRVKDALPNAKLILSLRHPADRLYSQYCKNLYQGRIKERDFHRWIETQSDAFEEDYQGVSGVYQNRYSVHLEHWLSLFRRDQLHVVIFERWTREPALMFEGLCDFLNLREYTPDAFAAFNTGASIRSRLAGGSKFSLFERLLRRMRDRKPAGCPEMRLATREMLTACFAADIEKTERLLGLDLSIWRDGAPVDS